MLQGLSILRDGRRYRREMASWQLTSWLFSLAIFAGGPDVTAVSVGQQIATAAVSAVLGFGALVLIFRFKSFREVIDRGRAPARVQT